MERGDPARWWNQTDAFFEMALSTHALTDRRKWLLLLAAYVRNTPDETVESADEIEADAERPVPVADDPHPPSLVGQAVDWLVNRLQLVGLTSRVPAFLQLPFVTTMVRMAGVDRRMLLRLGIDQDDPIEGNVRLKCDLMRELFVNPYAPIEFDPQWRSSTALALARQIDELREWHLMPILADALEDAGCEDDTILQHCRRDSPPHYRGCWVIDLVRK